MYERCQKARKMADDGRQYWQNTSNICKLYIHVATVRSLNLLKHTQFELTRCENRAVRIMISSSFIIEGGGGGASG